MSTRFPATGIDDSSTLPNPAANNFLNSPTHAGLHGNANDAIKAVETKLGTGATTPASATLLIGTGAGTSAWSALTSSQLAGLLSDETGTGSAVFATTPTLVTPKVDTINEATGGNGVTVAGLNFKSGAITASSVITTANLQDSAVTPAKLVAGTGTTWAMQSYTPTLTNMTLGNGTLTISYGQVGKRAFVDFSFVLGSTSAIGTNPTVSLPVTAHSKYGVNSYIVGTSFAEDTGVAGYPLTVELRSTSVFLFEAIGAAGSYTNTSTITSSIPFTWGTGDKVSASFSYEVA